MEKILIIAPHPDDEILGLGGTMIKHIVNGDKVSVCIVTKGIDPLFQLEQIEKTRSEAKICHEMIGVHKTIFLDFPAVMIEKVNRYEVNARILDVINEIQPDIVYIPHWGDMQKDHQLVTEACMVALRPKYEHVVKLIYAYETLSETGWNIPNVQNVFNPNVYVDISDYLDEKLDAMKYYKSQLGEFPEARSLEALKALAMFRGATVGVKAAEAFELVRKII